MIRNKKKSNLKLLILFAILIILIISFFSLIFNYKTFIFDMGLPSVGIFGEIDESIFNFSSPIDGYITTLKFIAVGFNINKENIKSFKYNFNGANFSIYDDSLVLMMDFDNNSIFGEDIFFVKDFSSYDNYGFINSFEKQNNGNPVIDYGEFLKFDSNGLEASSVIYVNGMYHMWYTGALDTTHYKIGYAKSSDGINWVRQNNREPVLDVGASGKFDEIQVRSPNVIYKDNEYHMWYSGYDGVNFKIGYATSLNGINWSRENNGNPVLDLGSSGKFDDINVYFPSVIYKDNEYQMWYSAYDGAKIRIGFAKSFDGIAWNKENNGDYVFDVGNSGTFDSNNVNTPNVIFNNNRYEMFYSGNNGSNYKIGFATSNDGINWIRQNNNNPIIKNSDIALNFDKTNVLYPNVLLINNIYNIWYTGCLGIISQSCRIGLSKNRNLYVSSGSLLGSFYFKGNSEYLSIPYKSQYDLTDEYTISGKINRDFFISADQDIFTKGDETGKDFTLQLTSDGRLRIRDYKDDGSYSELTSLNQISTSSISLQNFAVVKKSDGFYIYLDGVFNNSGLDSGNLGNTRTSNRPLYIGWSGDFNSPNYFKGNIDNLRVWNKALSDEEISLNKWSYLKRLNTDIWKFSGYQTSFNSQPLYYGSYTLQGFLEDSVSNKYETLKRTVYIRSEILPPVITIDYPVNGGVIASETLQVLISSNEELSSCAVSLNNFATNYSMIVNSNIASYSIQNLIDGSYTARFGCKDLAGNDNNNAQVSFSVQLPDTTNPGIMVDSPLEGSFNHDNYLWFMINSNEKLNSCKFTLNNWINNQSMLINPATYTYATYRYLFSLDGAYNAKFSCEDLAGNINNSASVNFNIEATIPPEITINNPINGSKILDNQVSFSLSSNEPLGSCIVSINNFISNRTMSLIPPLNVDAEYLYDINSNGAYTARFYCKDSMGNINDSMNVNFSVEIPTIKINYIDPTPINGLSTTQKNHVIKSEIFILDNNADLLNMDFKMNEDTYNLYDESLIAMYNFDYVESLEESGFISYNQDLSRNNLSIKCMGLPDNCPKKDVNCKYINCLNIFSGNSFAYINTGDKLNNSNEISFSVWIKTNESKESIPIFYAGYTSYSHRILISNSTNNCGFGVYSGKWINTGCPALNNDKWHYLTGVYDGSNIMFYVDGILFNFVPAADNYYNDNIFVIGKSSTDFFNGTVDELRIWNRSLTSDEVYFNYISNLRKYEKDKWEFYVNYSDLTAGVYDYSVYAKDDLANSEDNLRNLIITNPVVPGPSPGGSSGPSGSGGPSGPSTSAGSEFFIKTYYTDDSSFLKGYNNKFRERYQLIFNKNKKNNSFGVLNMTNTTVKINSSFFSGSLIFKLNEEKKYDLDNDNYYDISVKLNNIRFGYSNFTFLSINEKIDVIEIIENKTIKDKPASPIDIPFDEPGTLERFNLLWILIGVIVIIGIGIILIVFFILKEMKKRKEIIVRLKKRNLNSFKKNK